MPAAAPASPARRSGADAAGRGRVPPLREALILFGCLVVAIILHEISHGVAASAFGDDTAKRAGRLTLNPIPHIDPFGSIPPARSVLIRPASPVIGWAKPGPGEPGVHVAVRARHRVSSAWAGPATNFLLMAVAAVADPAERFGSNRQLPSAGRSTCLLKCAASRSPFYFAVQ